MPRCKGFNSVYYMERADFICPFFVYRKKMLNFEATLKQLKNIWQIRITI